MGYAKYIGRVGALAVTLGVGVAMASAPPVAYAETSDSSTSTSDSSKTESDSPTDTSPSTGGSEDADKSESGPESPSGAVDGAAEDTETTADEETVDESEESDVSEESEVEQDSSGGEGDDDAALAGSESDEDDVPGQDAANVDSNEEQGSGGDDGQALTGTDASDDESPPTATFGTSAAGSTGNDSQLRVSGAVDNLSAIDDSGDDSVGEFTMAATTFAAMTVADPAPEAPRPRPTLVSVVTGIVSDLMAAVLSPLMGPGTGSPLQASVLLGVLGAVRTELERALFPRTSNASRYTVTELDPTPNSASVDPIPNVLVIGVDGTNLSRILADDRNQNFFALMEDSTTAASSIVGHTTLSNPSWTAILTGAWGEKTGVINNVFTPWTYNKWPTVFNQLETNVADIRTTAIADWDVINGIAGAGSNYVDTNIYYAQQPGDTYWDATDDLVGEATVDAIEATAADRPAFIFSYFVGVDENGHNYGGASDEYANAIVNVDDNLGGILQAVQDWETAHPDDGEWTIIVVTDHGHQPQKGFGHGFQTPDETATFVIARGEDFGDGLVNPDYEIVDTTPTVLSLFGAPIPGNLDGVPLMDHSGSDEGPYADFSELQTALEDMIATNHSPDLITNVALSLRTIAGTIPYFIWTLNNDGTIPAPILGDVLYVATNIPAQIIAFLTGVRGASIFPIIPPGPPTWPEDKTITVLAACSGGAPGSSAELCDAGSVA